jgi:serine/threonine protein kinase/tetratricopeptide (TPR) repeat protein
MSTLDWNALWSHFHRIVTLDQDERKAALAELPAEQVEELEALLRAHDQDDSLLDRPVILSSDIQPGFRIGPWELRSLLGEGGMGQVWLADRADGAYERQVAIKLLTVGAPSPNLAQRFAREREILARLDHPNIARLIDGGTLDNGQPYLVMERVEGQTLAAYAKEASPGLRERLQLMRRICAAVDHAHRRLIVHRDLKPANVLVTASGEPKLLDFGIARLLDPEQGSEQTVAAERRLTLEYASPEQLRGEPVDTRSDAFSLGVILFELLVGQRPWSIDGCSASQAHDRLTGRSPSRVSRVAATPALRRRLRGDLDWIVGRAIEPDPERRYADARELGEDLQRYLDGFPVHARPPSRRYRVGRFIRRHPWGVGSASLVLLMMVSAGTVLWQQSRALAVALEAAQQESARAGSLSEFLAELLVESDPEVHQGDPRTVEEVLSDAADRIESEFSDQPELKARLLNTLAGIFFSRGDYPRAQRLVTDSLALGDPESTRAARLLQARLALVDGRYDSVIEQTGRLIAEAATETADRARVLRAEAFQAMDDLEAAALALGDIDVSAKVGEMAVEAWFRQGGLHWGRGDFVRAEDSYREAWAIQKATHGEESSQAARGLNAIASARYRQGDLAGAEDLFRQVLARHERILGPDHPQTAETRVRLGALLYDRGDPEAAIVELERALVDQTAAFGADHIALANTHNNLALALAARGDFTAAESRFRAALAINEATHGPVHRRVAGNLANLGWMKIEQGQPAQARPLLLDALERQQQVFDGDHPQLAYTLHHLGRAALLDADLITAEDWLGRALQMRETLFGGDHPSLADTHLMLADLREAAGEPDRAVDHLQAVLRIRDLQGSLSAETRASLNTRLSELSQASAGGDEG